MKGIGGNSRQPFRTRISKPIPLLPCADTIFSCLFCKLKTCSHMGKLAATWENLQPPKGQHSLGGNTMIASDRIGKEDMRLTDVYGHVISDVLS